MQTFRWFAAPLALAVLAMPLAAQAATKPAPINPQIDYQGFRQLVRDLEPVREQHRLAWADFDRAAHRKNALLLDARSADAFARGHLKGAVNLPFTDFTAETLQATIGANPNRPIYIYCNNNFRDHAPPVALKALAAALNIPTFINLHAYGYANVWELADVIGSRDPGVDWEASPEA